VDDVLIERRRGRVLELRLNRPDRMNALNTAVIDSIGRAAASAAADNSVAAVFITAEGRAFSAGADLLEAREQLSSGTGAFRGNLYDWQRAFSALEDCPKPVIAIVQGLAIAGGLELALSCDLIVATDRARLGDGHITYGLVPGGGGSQRLTDAIGSRAARWLMYTGETVDAQTALGLGLVQQVVPAAEIEAWLDQLAESLSQRSPAALTFMKRMTASGQVSRERLDHEIEAAVHVVGGPDAQEGMTAFGLKRAPQFPSLAGL
jgi:enoyl-CoA hydratase/carnithine racemase